MKKEVKKSTAPKKVATKKGIKTIPAMKVETIKDKPVIIVPEKVEFRVPAEKIQILTQIPLPANHIRCIVLKDHEGMYNFLKENDIVDIPERRYKSDSFRGLVAEYKGERQPNKRR